MMVDEEGMRPQFLFSFFLSIWIAVFFFLIFFKTPRHNIVF